MFLVSIFSFWKCSFLMFVSYTFISYLYAHSSHYLSELELSGKRDIILIKWVLYHFDFVFLFFIVFNYITHLSLTYMHILHTIFQNWGVSLFVSFNILFNFKLLIIYQYAVSLLLFLLFPVNSMLFIVLLAPAEIINFLIKHPL